MPVLRSRALWFSLAITAVTEILVLTTTQVTLARFLEGLFLGAFVATSLGGFIFAQRRLGLFVGALALSVAWGLVFFLLALSVPQCPDSPSRCTLPTATSYLGIGLLTPAVFLLLLSPFVVTLRWWLRSTPEQRRHPLRARIERLRAWALARRSPSSSHQDAPAVSSRRTPASRTLPPLSSHATKQPPPGVVHRGRVTSSPRKPKPL